MSVRRRLREIDRRLQHLEALREKGDDVGFVIAAAARLSAARSPRTRNAA